MWYCVAFPHFLHRVSISWMQLSLVSEPISICNLTKQFRDHTKINYHLRCPTCAKHQSKHTTEADSCDQRWGLTLDAVFWLLASSPSLGILELMMTTFSWGKELMPWLTLQSHLKKCLYHLITYNWAKSQLLIWRVFVILDSFKL